MSLRPVELGLLAAELSRELEGAAVQKVAAPTSSRVYLELRVPGRTVTLLVCCEPGVARVSAVEARPSNPPTPPAWQAVLRRELVGARLRDAEALPARRTLLLHFSREARHLTLVLEVTQAPLIALCNADATVLALSGPARPEVRGGRPWRPLEEHPAGEQPSRLAGDHVALRLAHAAEALLATVEQKTRVDARRAPLLAKLKRLDRTREKVREEANREQKVAQYRREGQLLTHHLHLVKRGAPSVRLTEYLEDGTQREVEIALDPKRSAREEVDWRFHQARRLTRGAELARQRLAQLEDERRALEARLAALAAEPAPPEGLAPPSRKPEAQRALPPYREYRGHGGQRIWVGRGSAHNDALTFGLARPFHLWLHARGLPGAHVVVPLPKNGELSQEVLLDAAHLAAFHSDAKGEPRAEVSYVPVKFVRKPKGGAPGAVTFTREKTLLLRLEPTRLERVLGTLAE